MTQIKTAREMLAQIEKDFFKGAGLDNASLLKGEERRAYRLAQVDRLLSMEPAADHVGISHKKLAKYIDKGIVYHGYIWETDK